MKKKRNILAVAGIIVALTSASALPANAADTTNQIAQLVAEVAPNQGQVVPLEASRGAFEARNAKSSITVPVDSRLPVTLSDDTTSGAESFDFKLPVEVTAANGTTAKDGTIVYRATDGGASAAVQVLSDGSARVQTIIPNKESDHQFTYEIDEGYTPATAEDGSIVLSKLNADGTYNIVSLAAPWAKDAKGKSVATRYEVRGNAVVQIVEKKNSTSYPLVADPKWAWVLGSYGAKFNKAETKRISNSATAIGVCGLVYAFPPLLAVCGAFGSAWIQQAKNAVSMKSCVFIAAVPAPIPYVYKDNDCK